MDLSLIKQRLVEGDAQGTADGARQALAEKVSAEAILKEALIPGMEEVGDLFARNEYFVPELLLSRGPCTRLWISSVRCWWGAATSRRARWSWAPSRVTCTTSARSWCR